MATKKTSKKATYKSFETVLNAPLKGTPKMAAKREAEKANRAAEQQKLLEAQRATAAKAKTTTPKAKPAKTKKAKGDATPKKVSLINAAHQLLAETGKPMNTKDLVALAAENGLWSSPAGKTPHATLYAAILREIATKGKDARFKKTDRGLFAANA